MDEQLLEEIVARAVADAISRDHVCRCDIPQRTHLAHHELIAELTDTLARIKDIRWTLLRNLAQWLLAAVLVLAGLGLRERLAEWMRAIMKYGG